MLSLILVPSAWPTHGLPSLCQAAGSAAKSGVCGKVWKRDELAYKCKTCERDSTCVVCVQCFRNGDHTGHDFAMTHTSGGCCDCGDVQAWRIEGFCRNHPGACSENEDPARELDSSLRRNLVDIVQVVAEQVLLLCLETRQKGTPPEGRVSEACELLGWLLQVVQCGDGIRRVVGLCLADPAQWPSSIVAHAEANIDLSKESWLRVMLEIDGVDRLPTRIQDMLHKVYFQLITDLVFKKTFMKMFIHNYESYLYAQIKRKWHKQDGNQAEDHHIGTDIVDNFSVQLFTVPALVPVMICQGGLLDVLMNVLLNLFETYSAVVRPYDETVPYEESAFANEYQTVPRRQRYRHSKDAASSSTAPNLGLRGRRHYLPIPFSTPEAGDGVDLMDDVEGGLEEQQSHGRDTSRNFSAGVVRSTGSAELHSWPQCESGVETENTRYDPQLSMPQYLTREPTEDESAEERMSVEVEVHSAVGTDLAENMNVDTNEEDDIGLLVPDTHEDTTVSPDPHDVFADGQVVAADDYDSDSEILTLPFHPLDEIFEMGMLAESEEETFERVDAVDSTHIEIQERLAVFKSGLRWLSSRTTGILHTGRALSAGIFASVDEPVAQQLEQVGTEPAPIPGVLQRAVHEARIMEETAVLGTGPLAHTLRLGWPREQDKISVSIIWKVMSDLKYVLTHRAVAFHLVHVRKDLFRKLVRVLSMAQGMNAVGRKLEDHVVNETDSATIACTIEMEINFCIELLSEAFCGLNLSSSHKTETGNGSSFQGVDLAASRLECIQIVRSCLDEWLDREEALEARSVYKDESFSISHAVSIHLPLHRFLAFMVHHVLRQDQVELETTLSGGAEQLTAADACRIAKHPLRIFALLAQVRAGMWRRNGYSFTSQLRFYQNGMISDWFIDLDLFLVQCCAVVIGPDEFIRETQTIFRICDLKACLEGLMKEGLVDSPNASVSSAHNFGLLSLAPRKYMVRGRFGRRAVYGAGNTFAELISFIPTLIEELFLLIVRVASERGKCGLGEAQALRRKLLHQLCCHDRTYSQLSRVSSVRISNELDSHDDEADNWSKLNTLLQSIIADVGVYIEPKGMQQGKYKLKDELWQEFDPFELHLSAEDRNTALVRQAATRKGPEKRGCAIPSDNISDRPIFFQLKDLCKFGEAVCTHEGLATLLLRRLLRNKGSEIMEGILPAALHLTCMAVEETARQGTCQTGQSLNHLLLEGPRANVALVKVCELYNMSKTADNPVLFETLPVLDRILRRAGQRGDLLLREFLQQKIGSWVLGASAQSSRPTATTEEGSNWEMTKTDRKEMLRRGKELQKASLAQIQKQQAKFAQFIDVGSEDDSSRCKDRQKQPRTVRENELGADGNQEELKHPIPHNDELRSPGAMLIKSAKVKKQCAFCHDDSNDDGGNLLGLIGFHQKTRILAVAKEQCEMPSGESCTVAWPLRNLPQGSHADRDCSTGIKEGRTLGESFILNQQLLHGGVEVGESVHLFFCGHSVHSRCFDRYFRSLKQTREETRDMFEGHTVPNLDKHEFLCPLCRRLANVVFPLITAIGFSDSVKNFEVTSHMNTSMSFEKWIQRCNSNLRSCPMSSGGEARSLAKSNTNSCFPESKIRMGHTVDRAKTAHALRLLPISRPKAMLERFGLWSSPNICTLIEPAADVISPGSSGLGSYARVPSAAITTAACAEVAARSIPWNDNFSYPSRRSLVMILWEARALTKLESELRSEALCILWTEIQSAHARNLDPFVTVSYLFLLWPEPFTVDDAKGVVQLGLSLICGTLQCNKLDNSTSALQLTYDILLYIRRCCIILSSYFEALAEPPIAVYDDTDKSYDAALEELTALLSYLNIPKPSQLDVQPQEAFKLLSPGSSPLTSRPKRITLLKLPRLYQTLLEELDGRKCIYCVQNRLSQLALCLVCGSLLCPSSRKCGFGGLGKHAAKCGNGIGVFLSLKYISVLVIREDRSSYWGSPYLDAHGEEDEWLRRGKPLYLNQVRYSALERMWLTHSFDQDSRILSRTIRR